MFVMTLDQRGSRSGRDLVPQTLVRLAEVLVEDMSPVAAFERTAGDEIQGVLGSPQAVYAVIRLLLRDAAWYVGIGHGTVDQPIPQRAAEGSGPAYWAAREAVNLAKTKRASTPIAFISHSGSEQGADVNGLLQLLGFVFVGRSAPAWQAIDLVTTSYGTANGCTQKQAAQTLGISPAAVSDRLRNAGLNQELEAQPVILRILSAV